MAVKDCVYCFRDGDYVEPCVVCFGVIMRAYNAALDRKRSKLPRATHAVTVLRG